MQSYSLWSVYESKSIWTRCCTSFWHRSCSCSLEPVGPVSFPMSDVSWTSCSLHFSRKQFNCCTCSRGIPLKIETPCSCERTCRVCSAQSDSKRVLSFEERQKRFQCSEEEKDVHLEWSLTWMEVYILSKTEKCSNNLMVF